MWFIYISLCLGWIIGAANFIPKKLVKYQEMLSIIFILVLLFLMGLNIGLNKEVIKNIEEIGLIGLIYAFFSVFFSIIVSYFLTNNLIRRKKQ